MYDLNELNRIAAEYGAQVQIDPHEYEMATIISVRLGNKVAAPRSRTTSWRGRWRKTTPGSRARCWTW